MSKKISIGNIALFLFLIAGAAGLTQLAEWILRNLLTPIDDIVAILERGSIINQMDPISIVISYFVLMIGIYGIGIINKNIIERIQEIIENI